MNYKAIFLTLLIASSATVLFPLFTADTEVSLIPNTVNSTYMSVRQPNIKFETTLTSQVLVNITYLEQRNNESTLLHTNLEIQEILEVEGLRTGFYRIDMVSDTLGTVNISSNGLHMTTLVIFIVLVLINLYFLYVKLDEMNTLN